MANGSKIKPVSTAQLGLALLSFIERFGVTFIVVLLQYARVKQKKAEDKVAYLEAKEVATQAKDAVDAKYQDMSDRDVILSHLGKSDEPNG